VTLSLAFAAFTASSASAVSISETGGYTVSGPIEATWTHSNSAISTIRCAKSEGTGIFTSSTGGTVSLGMSGCNTKTFFGESACTTPGQPSGRIVISTGTRLVWLNPAHTEYGLLISPEPGILTEVSCITLRQWEGSFLAKITSPALNVRSKQATLLFQSKAPGVGAFQYEIEEGPFKGSFGSAAVTDGNGTLSLDQKMTITFNGGKEPKFVP
jgi:hypothetical protein